MPVVEISVQAAFGADLLAASGPGGWTWTEIGTRVSRIRWQGPRRTSLVDAIQAGVLTVELDNSDGVLDPRSTTAAVPYVVAGVSQVRPRLPVWFRARYPDTSGTYVGIGVGYRSRGTMKQERPAVSTVTWTCPDGQQRLSVDRPATTPEGEGSTPGERVRRLLDLIPWPSGGEDLGLTPMQASTFAGNALEELQAVAAAEFADMFINGDGYLLFRDRKRRLVPGAAVAAFSEASSTLDPTDVVIVDEDNRVVNRVAATRAGGVEQVSDSTTSQAKFGVISRTFSDLPMTEDHWAKALAEGIVLVFGDWAPQVESVTLDPTANAALWPIVLSLQIGNYITVLVDGYLRHCWVEGVDHDIEQVGDSMTSWTTTVWTTDFGTVRPYGVWDETLWGTAVWGW